jgi:hypothetical protein
VGVDLVPCRLEQNHRRAMDLVCARLAGLEKVRLSESAKFDSGPAIEKMRGILRICGIEQSPTESLAEAFARALGISCRELKARLQTGHWHTVLGVNEREVIHGNPP